MHCLRQQNVALASDGLHAEDAALGEPNGLAKAGRKVRDFGATARVVHS